MCPRSFFAAAFAQLEAVAVLLEAVGLLAVAAAADEIEGGGFAGEGMGILGYDFIDGL